MQSGSICIQCSSETGGYVEARAALCLGSTGELLHLWRAALYLGSTGKLIHAWEALES